MPRSALLALVVVAALAAGAVFVGPCTRDDAGGVATPNVAAPTAAADAEKARRHEAAPEDAEKLPAAEPTPAPAARATVIVRVTAAEDKTPIAGADVELARDDAASAAPRHAKSDAAGAARFDVEPGVVTVHAAAAERVVSELWSDTATTERETTIDIALERGVALDGLVLDAANGRPIDGARVEVVRGGLVVGFGDSGSDAPPLGRVTTSGDGRFRVRVPANEIVTATASARGFAEDGRALVVAGGDAARPPVVLRLDAAGTLRGTVRAPDGTAVAGAKVYLMPAHVADMLASEPDQWVDQGGRRWTSLVGTTDAAGRYEIGGLDRGGKYAAFAKGEGRAASERREAVFVTVERPAAEADFALRRFSSVVVHTEDGAGAPKPATISCRRVGGPPPSAAVASGGVTTVQVEPGSYEVMAEAAGVPQETAEVEVAEDAVVDVVLRFADPVAIAGLVLDDRGSPVPKARLTVLRRNADGSTSTAAEAVADGDGRFRAVSLRASSYLLAARDPRQSLSLAPIPVEAPSDDLRVVLPRLARVTLRLVPAPGGTTWLRQGAWHADVTSDVAWASSDLGQSALVGLSGQTVTFWVAPGKCHVRTQFVEYAPLTLDFETSPGQELDLGDVPLSLGLDLVGRVEDARGVAVPGALVTLGEMYAPGHRDATTGADGGFRLPRLAAGKVGIAVLAPDFVRTYVETDLAAGAAPLVVRLVRGGLVRVTVVDAAGAPVVGESVGVGDYAGDTDHRGICVVRVPAGKQRVAVQEDSAADVEVVDGGETAVRLVVR